MIVSASSSDTSTAIESVIDNAWKNCPTTPCNRPNGRNTTTVVIVDDVTGQTSSRTASRIAACRSALSSTCRAMFSVITTASSITRPMAMAIAPNVMRLNVWPTRRITNTVIMSVRGIDVALIAVMRACRRNTSRINTASTAPTSIASRTERTASRTNEAWSYTALSRTPGGSVACTCAAIAATLSAISSVLPPICRVMLSNAAGRPSPAITLT